MLYLNMITSSEPSKKSRNRHKKLVEGYGLTEQQKAFVVSFVMNGGKRQQAAKDAGYSDPRTCSHRLLQQPHIKEAIKAERDAQLQGDMASMGIDTIRELLSDKEASAHVRLQAAKWVLEACGHGAVNRTAESNIPLSEKPLHEMTIEELDDIIRGSTEKIVELNSVANFVN